MRKFVVETQTKYGSRSTRLVPAKNAHTARANCTAEGVTIISVTPYTGQWIADDHLLLPKGKKWGSK